MLRGYNVIADVINVINKTRFTFRLQMKVMIVVIIKLVNEKNYFISIIFEELTKTFFINKFAFKCNSKVQEILRLFLKSVKKN